MAHIAAVQAHHDLGLPPGGFPVPVESAIAAAGLPLLWRPLGQLFGVYLHVDGQPGIMINERLTRSGRRHTAAHELGHHRFHHQLHPGVPCAIDTGDAPAPTHRWNPVERAAEAFADWFLMPRKAVLAAMDCLGLHVLTDPADVYQLSLLLGTSYRATVRHLLSLRLITAAEQNSWSSVSPGKLKRQLLVDPLPSTREVDVWMITEAPANPQPNERHVAPDDLVIIPRPLLIDPAGLPAADNGNHQLIVTAPQTGVHHIQLADGDGSTVALRLVVEPRPHGLQYPGSFGATTPVGAEATG